MKDEGIFTAQASEREKGAEQWVLLLSAKKYILHVSRHLFFPLSLTQLPSSFPIASFGIQHTHNSITSVFSLCVFCLGAQGGREGREHPAQALPARSPSSPHSMHSPDWRKKGGKGRGKILPACSWLPRRKAGKNGRARELSTPGRKRADCCCRSEPCCCRCWRDF